MSWRMDHIFKEEAKTINNCWIVSSLEKLIGRVGGTRGVGGVRYVKKRKNFLPHRFHPYHHKKPTKEREIQGDPERKVTSQSC